MPPSYNLAFSEANASGREFYSLLAHFTALKQVMNGNVFVPALALLVAACSSTGGGGTPSGGAASGTVGSGGAVAGAAPLSSNGSNGGASNAGAANGGCAAGGDTCANAGAAQGGTQGGAPPLTLPAGHGPGAIFELGIDAPDRPVKSARLSLYVPDGITKLSGVIVHQHGCGRDGITVPHDLHWQALANRWGMALMGTQFPTLFPDGDHCDRWSHIENGSGDVFVSALARFASDSGHAELNDVPWVLWGHSGGATWAFQMSKKYPGKTLAVVLKSICEADPAFSQAIVGVPTLLATGALDLGQCYPITTQIFESYRAAGAPWAYVDEPEGTHDSAKLRLLAIPYLDSIIAARLKGPIVTDLHVLPESEGFLADNQTSTVAAAGTFAGDKSRASWLPSAPAAEAWRQFVTTRSVQDSSPPTQPPTDLTAKIKDNQVTLRWLSDVDLESGVRAFNVYRDGSLVLTVPSSNQPFQFGNYGDEPEPKSPGMFVVDSLPGQLYRVTLVNGSGLESPPSAEVTPTAE